MLFRSISYKGELKSLRPEDILAQVINKLISPSNLNKDDIEDVIVGCAFPEGEQGFNIGKVVTFMCDLPRSVAGMTVNRWCGSSMQACIDEPHHLFTVMPATLLGRSHMKVTTLPILKPCSPSGNAQPTITSSISSLFKFDGEINLLIT